MKEKKLGKLTLPDVKVPRPSRLIKFNVGVSATEILEAEIKRMKEKHLKETLSFMDAKKLELLVKLNNLIQEKPTEIISTQGHTYSDEDVLGALSDKKKKT